MTTAPTAQRPTGNPGTAPRGPAGLAPEPHGPKNPSPRPTTQKPPPAAPPKGTSGTLLAADDALASVESVLATRLPDPATQEEATAQAVLEFRLRGVRRAVRDLIALDSGREGKVPATAAPSRPVQSTRPTAGECLTPGSGTVFSGAVTESAGAVVAPSAGQISDPADRRPAGSGRHRAGRPPSPGAGFDLPVWPGTAAMAAAFVRRSD